MIARRKSEHGSGRGAVRWMVERTFALMHHLTGLLVRSDRSREIPLGVPRHQLLPRLLPTAGELILIQVLTPLLRGLTALGVC